MEHFPREVVDEIVSYLDFPDLGNLIYSSAQFYRCRRELMDRRIKEQTEYLRRRENSSKIPRQELISHNAFLSTLNQTYLLSRPDETTLKLLVSFFSQELIFAWMYPTAESGLEIRVNGLLEDTRIYRKRFPHLERLAWIIRWNGLGEQVATTINEWHKRNWNAIKDDENLRPFIRPDYDVDPLPPHPDDFTPEQEMTLRGLEFFTLAPIVYFEPQDAAAAELFNRFNAQAWAHPAFNRLKLWLSIPELWNIDIYHLEIKIVMQTRRVYRRIARRPFLHPILFKCGPFPGFSMQILLHMRSIETSRRGAEPIPGCRYWYEEIFVASALWDAFQMYAHAGQYISLFQQTFADIIRGYVFIFGRDTLSDLVLNIVFFVQDRPLPVRTIIARTMARELKKQGYKYVNDTARNALVGMAGGIFASSDIGDREREKGGHAPIGGSGVMKLA